MTSKFVHKCFEIDETINNLAVPAANAGTSSGFYTTENLFPGIFSQRMGSNIVRFVADGPCFVGFDSTAKSISTTDGALYAPYVDRSSANEAAGINKHGDVTMMMVPAGFIEHLSYRYGSKLVIRNASATDATTAHVAFGRLV